MTVEGGTGREGPGAWACRLVVVPWPDATRHVRGVEPGTLLTICTRCWVVVTIDGEQNHDRAPQMCSHLGPAINATVEAGRLSRSEPDQRKLGEPVTYASPEYVDVLELMWLGQPNEEGQRPAWPARRDVVAQELLARCGEGTAESPWNMDALLAFAKHVRGLPGLVRDDDPRGLETDEEQR
jgi:hypothetical protein